MHYVALFAGESPKTARIVCAVMDPEVVAEVAKAGLRNLQESSDPVLGRLTTGSREALREVVRRTQSNVMGVNPNRRRGGGGTGKPA